MVQGTIAGSTSYNNQSLKDILEDIDYWKEYSETINQNFDNFIHSHKDNIKELISKNLISTNLISFFSETIKTTKTFIEDFQSIYNDIISENITDKTVNLLENIGEFSSQENIEYGRTWHSDQAVTNFYLESVSDIHKQLYCKGRDYFVTLQDASNAAKRLNQYKGTTVMKTINNTFNATGNNIQQGTNLTMNNNISYSEDVLSKLDIKLEELLKNTDNSSSKENIIKIKEETKKTKPNKKNIRTYLENIKVLEKSANIVTIISGITNLLGLIH
ncbi:hypothetical protein [Weissella bombi]|uniref:hypothetical protein n=1 Tax=Weissella bombi TaxID=1505725 RepID=UPI003AF26CDD